MKDSRITALAVLLISIIILPSQAQEQKRQTTTAIQKQNPGKWMAPIPMALQDYTTTRQTALAHTRNRKFAEALTAWERVIDRTNCTEEERLEARSHIQSLLPYVLPVNTDKTKAKPWNTLVILFKDVTYTWVEKDGSTNSAHKVMSEKDIKQIQKSVKSFGEHVFRLSSGVACMNIDMHIVEQPFSKKAANPSGNVLTSEDIQPYIKDMLNKKKYFTIMSYAKCDEGTGPEVPRPFVAALRGRVPEFDNSGYMIVPWCTYYPFPGETDGEMETHEWLHQLYDVFHGNLGYPKSVVRSPDTGQEEGSPAAKGDSDYRKPKELKTWIHFYEYIMRVYTTRQMWTEITTDPKPSVRPGDVFTPYNQPQLPVIPSPHTAVLNGSNYFRIIKDTQVLAATHELLPVAERLKTDIQTMTAIPLPEAKVGTNCSFTITLQVSANLKNEAYRCRITSNSIILSAGAAKALSLPISTLLQMIEETKDGSFAVRSASITDAPSKPYRGVMIDLARKYHSPESIKQVIEMCSFYKINQLHLHLTDDQLYMFPSKAFPNAGRDNHEFARFDPLSRSDKIEPYTTGQLIEIDSHAKRYGVSIIPELDMPGHSGQLISAYPDIFRIQGNGSTINIANTLAVDGAKKLLDEVASVFKTSEFIHIGGDEASLHGLEQTPQYADALQRTGARNAHDLYMWFNKELADHVIKLGKRPLVWEEALGGGANEKFLLPKQTIPVFWILGRSPADAVTAGYDIINASWTPLYIVRSDKHPISRLFSWNFNDFGAHSASFRNWNTLNNKTNQILGAQLCSWENSASTEIQALRVRTPAMAEQLWAAESKLQENQFDSKITIISKNLDRLIHPINIKVSGSLRPDIDENSFDGNSLSFSMLSRLSDCDIHYRTDNQLPSPGDAKYSAPINIKGNHWLTARLFRNGKPLGYPVCFWGRKIQHFEKNLATGKTLTQIGQGDSGSISLAVDGKIQDIGAHWHGGPVSKEQPAGLQVDLGKTEPISRLVVYTYYDGGRFYQFYVETSEDGMAWKRVADLTEERAVASPDGYGMDFKDMKARYLRVMFTGNSANRNVHVIEISAQ